VHSEGSVISTLWAREKIEDLQSQDWLGAQTNTPHPEIQAQIINTALEYHLMSQYTSFVAVEERVVNVGGRQRTLDVPVEIPDGVSYESVLPAEKKPQDRYSNYAGFGGGGFGATRAGAAGGGMALGRSGKPAGASAGLSTLSVTPPAPVAGPTKRLSES